AGERVPAHCEVGDRVAAVEGRTRAGRTRTGGVVVEHLNAVGEARDGARALDRHARGRAGYADRYAAHDVEGCACANADADAHAAHGVTIQVKGDATRGDGQPGAGTRADVAQQGG